MTTLKLSLRWSETTEAISLQATFIFGLLRYARNDKKNKMAARHKTSLHNKLFKNAFLPENSYLMAKQSHYPESQFSLRGKAHQSTF